MGAELGYPERSLRLGCDSPADPGAFVSIQQPVGNPDRRHETADGDNDPDDAAPERPVDRFRRGAVGSAVAAGLLGLRDALEGRPEQEEVTVVSEAPARDEHPILDVHLDPDDPTQSVAVIRPAARRAAPPEPSPPSSS
jgi:hypothetical protein